MTNKIETTEYTIVGTEPDIMPTLTEMFAVTFEDVVVTVGKNIHSKYPITLDLLEHEKTHVRQQLSFEGGPEAWWAKYLEDEKFRLSQEVEAYRVQYQYLRGSIKDRNKLAKHAHDFASVLAGPMYGKITTYFAAKLLIST